MNTELDNVLVLDCCRPNTFSLLELSNGNELEVITILKMRSQCLEEMQRMMVSVSSVIKQIHLS